MIVHIVLFEPRADLSADARQQVFADLRKAARQIPSVRRFRVGERIRHGLPGYEQAMRDDYGYALVAEFDDREGLEAYLAHPAHETVGHHFTASASRAIAYDYEMADIGAPD